MVIGQCKTEGKSNEITAVPELLKMLDLRGATVTIDAMGCQTQIAKTIIEGDGNYLISAKDNQLTLRKDIEKTCAEADDARHRAGNTAQNLATLRHFALNILRGDKDRKVGVANSRRRAGFDRRYPDKLVTGVGE